MRYDFKVRAEAFKIFDSSITDEEVNILKDEFSDFKITYNSEFSEDNKLAIIEVLEGNNDQHQILMKGFSLKNKTYEPIAYWFVGDSIDSKEYTEGINVLNTLLNEYRIK